MDIKIKAKYIKVSPQKMSLITDFVRNLSVFDAISQLRYLNKQSKQALIHLITSGINAAKDKGLSEDNLYIKSIICSQGPRLKRVRFISRGRTSRIKKRMSHIVLILSDQKDQKLKTKDQKYKRKNTKISHKES